MPVKSKAQSRYLNAHFGHDWVKRHGYDQKTGGLPEWLGGGEKKKRAAKKKGKR